jgi:anti-sigma B factor antagonist
MAGMDLSSRVCDAHVVVALCGELDYVNAADAEAAIIAVMARGQSLIVDMSALDFIDCSSLSILLRVQRLARQAGGDVVLAAPQRHALRLLALTGKDHTFCVHPSVQAAVTSIGSPGGSRYAERQPAVSTARLGRTAPLRTGGG